MTYYLMVALMTVINVEEQRFDKSLYVFQEPYFYDMQECIEHVNDDLDNIFAHLYVNYGPAAQPQQIYCVDSAKLEKFMADKNNFQKKDE